MSRRQLPRTTAAILDAATFLPGEIAVDTTNDELRYDGDGSTVGGIKVARKDGVGTSVTATGSTTARTLAERFAETVNILDFGVTEAAADNYANFNLAIARSNALGGATIYIPEGEYQIDLPDGVGLTSVVAGTRFKGAGEFVSVLVINCTTDTYLNAIGNAGDIIFEDFTIEWNLLNDPGDPPEAALLVLASNTVFRRFHIRGNNDVSTEASSNNCYWINVPSSGTIDNLRLENCTWSGLHYPLHRANDSTAVITNTVITGCRAWDNAICHLEFNAPNGSWTTIKIKDFIMGDQDGAGAGLGYGMGFASTTDVEIDGMTFIGQTDGEAIHVEENCDGFTLVNFYIDVTSDQAGEGDGIILLNNNIGGVEYAPKNWSISNGVIKRSGSTDAHGLWLLDDTDVTPLTSGHVDNVTIVGFTAAQNLTLQTSMASIRLGQITHADSQDIAAAATVDMGKAKSPYANITGSGQSITSFGSAPVGTRRSARFNGANTLTHNGTSLILPGAANITTASGDSAAMISLGSGNWYCESYTRAAGVPTAAIAAFLADPTSAKLADALTDESGSGVVPFMASGTFTPTLGFAVTNGDLAITYGTNSGRYVIVGNLVIATFEITTSAFTHTTASGVATISGLPFASASNVILWIGSTNWAGITKASYTQVALDVSNGVAAAVLVASGSGQALSAVSAADMPSGGTFRLRASVAYTI